MSQINNIIVKEYLESLKEDKELDYLFPMLLNVMGYRIISTPTHSKGQSQYGKDVIVVGIDPYDGIKKRFYFEIKGNKDKNIDSVNFNADDGIRMSILEAKDAAYKDCSIPEFNSLPIKIIIVHNGILKTNFLPQFDGFISQNFKEGEFDRWDINHLTDLFSKYLFGEYLLTDVESLKLFKKVLIYLDIPESSLKEFKALVNLQIEKQKNDKIGRSLTKFFMTMNLINLIIYRYCKDNNNLEPAKMCSAHIVLKLWAWILEHKKENNKSIISLFNKILQTHSVILDDYFNKTIAVARIKNGLFSEDGAYFESIGYPLRCSEYINYLTYYYKLSNFLYKGTNNIRIQKDTIKEIIRNNIEGFSKPIIDIHSIGILNTFLFILNRVDFDEDDLEFLAEYLNEIFNNLHYVKIKSNRFPELHNRIDALIEYETTGEKPNEFNDSSSLLITILFELTAILNDKSLYDYRRTLFLTEINLQTFYPDFANYDIEQLLFEKEIYDEGGVETNIKLDESFEEFTKFMQTNDRSTIQYRTDKVNLSFLRHLAHIYYKTPYFVDTWRHL